jgi:hypothetical protein
MKKLFFKTEILIDSATDELIFCESKDEKVEFLSQVIDELVKLRTEEALKC